MEVTKISKEAIEKAEIILGLRKATDSTDEVAKAAELKKAEEAKALEEEYAATILKAQDLKNKIDGKSATEDKESSATIEKAVKVSNEAFEKAVSEKFESLATLITSKNAENEELKKSVEALGVSLKKAEEFNAIIGKKIGIIEKQPLDRKSVTTENFIEKGGEAAAKLSNEGRLTELSLSNMEHRKQISDLLFEKAIEGGKVDGEFEKAVQYAELGGFPNQAVTDKIQRFLKENHKIKMVK